MQVPLIQFIIVEKSEEISQWHLENAEEFGVESFLDIAAAEDRYAYDEGESEVEEERFEL
ncbi:hypothetical protein AAF712_009285, partial [Marasmius tenuissimus]